METTQKFNFDVLHVVDIPESFFHKGVLDALRGRESFVDTDKDLNEQIFHADVFNSIISEQEGLGENSPSKLGADCISQIISIADETMEYELVRIIKI